MIVTKFIHYPSFTSVNIAAMWKIVSMKVLIDNISSKTDKKLICYIYSIAQTSKLSKITSFFNDQHVNKMDISDIIVKFSKFH